MKNSHRFAVTLGLLALSSSACLSSTVRENVLSAPAPHSIDIHQDPEPGQYALLRDDQGSEVRTTVVAVRNDISEVSIRQKTRPGPANEADTLENHLEVQRDGTVVRGWVTGVGETKILREKKVGSKPGLPGFKTRTIALPRGMPATLTVPGGTFAIQQVRIHTPKNPVVKLLVVELLSDQARFSVVRKRTIVGLDTPVQKLTYDLDNYNANDPDQRVRHFLFGSAKSLITASDTTFDHSAVLTMDLVEMK